MIRYHCSYLLRAGALRSPCRKMATVTWWNVFGWRIGSCAGHVTEMATEGKRKGWIYEGPVAELERPAAA